MNNLLKILVFILCIGLLTARTSGQYSGPDSFQQAKIVYSVDKKTYFASGAKEENENSIKWKRRHKRRKKAPNRKPQRGR